MAVITVFGASFCQSDVMSQKLSQRLGYRLIDDRKIINKASKFYGIAQNRFDKKLCHRTSIFEQFTHEKKFLVGYFKSIIAEYMRKDAIVFHGYAGHLIPRNISHVLRVCLIADVEFRLNQLLKEKKITKEEATKRIQKDDQGRREWREYFVSRKSSNQTLYDIILPIDKTNLEQAIDRVIDEVGKDSLKPTDASVSAVRDFVLASEVEVALAREGHAVGVSASDGKVCLTIDKQVAALSRLKEELKEIVEGVAEVENIEIRIGTDSQEQDFYRKIDSETPSRVLLVDDEREFVQTLSERLLMRDMGTVVAYDGMQALSIIDEDEPDVVILDLKMPEIDGIEVLRRVKANHPQVEVIVLTGHGSNEDKNACQKLGAFAYLQKPVDINVLTGIMKAAYEKHRQT